MVLSSSSWPVLRFQLFGVAAAGGVGVEQEIFLQREQQHEIVLGDGRVVHAGREEQRDAEFGAGLHVNLVHADAVFAQDLQFRARLFQNLARDGVVAADVAVHVADERERVRFIQRAARGDDFPAGLLEQIMMRTGRVLKRGRGEQNFHHGRLENCSQRVKKNNLRRICEGLKSPANLEFLHQPAPNAERAIEFKCICACFDRFVKTIETR